MDSSCVLGLRGFQKRPGDADLRDGGSASHLRLHRRLCGDEQPGPDQWLKIRPFLAWYRSSCECHVQQPVTCSSSSNNNNFQRAVLLGSYRWLQPRRCWSGSRERKNTVATSYRPQLISFCSSWSSSVVAEEEEEEHLQQHDVQWSDGRNLELDDSQLCYVFSCCSFGCACRELRRCWLLWASSGHSCSARTSPISSF